MMNPTPAGIILYKLKFDKNYRISAVLYWGETLSPVLVNFGTMTRKLQIAHISILFLLMALSSLALAPSEQVLLSPTETLETINPTLTVTHTAKPDLTPTATRPIRKLRPTSTIMQPTRNITATPVKTRTVRLDLEAGTSDWIVLIGILIVAIIVVPIFIKRKEWRGK